MRLNLVTAVIGTFALSYAGTNIQSRERERERKRGGEREREFKRLSSNKYKRLYAAFDNASFQADVPLELFLDARVLMTSLMYCSRVTLVFRLSYARLNRHGRTNQRHHRHQGKGYPIVNIKITEVKFKLYPRQEMAK